jgi:hypothetical protein
VSKQKCQRPDCKRKATVVIYRDNTPEGRKELHVCQLDVQWAHKQLYPTPTKMVREGASVKRVEMKP